MWRADQSTLESPVQECKGDGFCIWSHPVPRPSKTHGQWDGGNRAQEDKKDVPQREMRGLLLGGGTPASGEIPSQRNNTPEMENNCLFPGLKATWKDSPVFSPRLFSTLWTTQAQQALRKTGVFLLWISSSEGTWTGKQQEAQEEEEVYSCPQKSYCGLFSQSFCIP